MSDLDWLYQQRPFIPRPSIVRPIKFRDVNCDYTIDRNDLILEEDLAIKNQMRNILSTPIGSEEQEPDYGSDLPLMLYEPISELTGYLLESNTIVALSRWMNNQITISASATIIPLIDEEGYIVTIPYVIKSTNTGVIYKFDALR